MPYDRESRGWFSRNWIWAIPLGCLGMIALVVAFVAGIFFVVTGAMRSSGVYQTAISRAREHPDVTASLGEPIEVGWFLSGNIHVSGSEGEADLSLPLRGPRGSATLYVTANKVAGEWIFERLEVEIEESQERIDLMGAEDEASMSTMAKRPRRVASLPRPKALHPTASVRIC